MRKELINAREQYIELIKAELLGPGSEVSIPDREHELISDAPEKRYSVGILFPQGQRVNADQDDSESSEAEEEKKDGQIPLEPDEFLGRAVEEAEIQEKQVVESDRDVEDPDVESEPANLDEIISLASQNKPSSMGMSFFVSGNTEQIHCTVSYATYSSVNKEKCRIPVNSELAASELVAPFSDYLYFDDKDNCLKIKADSEFNTGLVSEWRKNGLLEEKEWLREAAYRLGNQMNGAYERNPHILANISIDFSEDLFWQEKLTGEAPDLSLTALKRQVSDSVYSITVMLTNETKTKRTSLNSIFQPVIQISTSNNDFVFKPVSEITDISNYSDEEKSLELQYRNKKNYGLGLGTSVNWDISSEGRGNIKTDFFPEVEVPSMDFNMQEKYEVEKETLSMKYLSDLCDTPKDEKVERLKKFIDAYETWIEEIDSKRTQLDEQYLEIANKNIEGCRQSLRRMKKGILILEDDDIIWDSFALANRAMFMQRIHLDLQARMAVKKERYPGDEEVEEELERINYYDESDSYYWRPFQLAFLLMSIDSIVNDGAQDRELVDLIWFPTGGGKTEAYLGLTAFTIFFRKIKYPEQSGGTAVIMRYTLRLLTAQQFTRAATLICACEFIRQDSLNKRHTYPAYNLGKERITIGLWIGGDHTPNTIDEAKENLKMLRRAKVQDLNYKKDRYNKFQVLKCPWCGTKLVKDIEDKKLVGEFGYSSDNHGFKIFCPQEGCFFADYEDSLPIQVIDQELYKSPPTLLFGTVDKFAMLPWKEEIGAFFALKSKNRSPELIIQDELHLISGPLGTMVGLYESAIDAMCQAKGRKTKIIASTATIRRAKEQCAALYDRDVMQFPHPGIDAEDSFFAREDTINLERGKYGRRYVGLMPSGKTKAMMESRVMAALLQEIKEMDVPDEIKDKYWTLTTYFNSLKELGKCSTLVADDVKDFIKRKAYRLGQGKGARSIGSADELTSRVSTSELNLTLDKLEKISYSAENIANRRYPSNVLLATNMISVGIDVARLNTMLIVGQPKLTSEYIQASSRIGRSFPGVAFTLYDGARSRDRSFYEQFKSYHEAFYKYVEPTGVTPYSEPARDRALHSVVISIMRHMSEELCPEEGAATFNRADYAELVNSMKSFLQNRNNSIRLRINAEMKDDTDKLGSEIDLILERWEELADSFANDSFTYGFGFMMKHPKEDEGRLLKVFNTSDSDNAFNTMTSMRNVDTAVRSNIIVWENEQ